MPSKTTSPKKKSKDETKLDYPAFLARKSQIGRNHGFEPLWIPEALFDFQQFLTRWSILQGRAALIEDCGLGKTFQFLVWAQNVIQHTNRPVLVLNPLAVSKQTVREGEKFGIDCVQSRDGKFIGKRIVVTNYERLHYFDPDDFAGIVGDEISCIKAFDGKRRKKVTRFMSKIKYRLGCTATAAPNDFIEVGTISEALGILSQSDMLGMFFKSSDNMRHSLFKEGDFWNRAKYFFRPHAEIPFWRWVCTFARAIRSPADLGFNGDAFILPPLVTTQHVVPCEFIPPGEMFPRIAVTLAEQREERKRTIRERCEKVAELVNHGEPSVSWCQYNAEGDLLEELIDGSVQVAGCDKDDEKEERLEAFGAGQIKKLVTKYKIASWGMNWQHCGHHTSFPSHSFEQRYQGLRRSLRFGRVGDVRDDIVTTPGEEGVTANQKKKQAKADQMFAALVKHMNEGVAVQTENRHTTKTRTPSWL